MSQVGCVWVGEEVKLQPLLWIWMSFPRAFPKYFPQFSNSPRSATKLEIILARCAEFFTPKSRISLSTKFIISSTPKNFLKLSSYSSSSSRFNQSVMSKCGRFAITIFLPCDFCEPKRKLHAIPEKREEETDNDSRSSSLNNQRNCPRHLSQ